MLNSVQNAELALSRRRHGFDSRTGRQSYQRLGRRTPRRRPDTKLSDSFKIASLPKGL